MITRRRLLQGSPALLLPACSGSLVAQQPDPEEKDGEGIWLNDKQSQLNRTRVASVQRPRSTDEVAAILDQAAKQSRPVSMAGGRHAMGGQQFGTDTVHLDTLGMNRVLKLDKQKGWVTAQAGITWPQLLTYLHKEQKDDAKVWSIRQKQTGVDEVTLAGTISANAHGRGLAFPPIVDDVESFVLVDAAGKTHRCSREENAELFSLAAGGYGLFGVITEVTLRLVPRTKVERTVRIIDVAELPKLVEQRRGEGYQFGDCQYSIDFGDSDRPHRGVFSCYRPIENDEPLPDNPRKLSAEDWGKLIYLAHVDKKRAFEAYAAHYQTTDGQLYWSDTHQLSNNFDNYHEMLDKQLKAPHRGSEMITEVYIPPDALLDFLNKARQRVEKHKINLIYGTMRFIEQDKDTFLAWAKQRSVCVLCNIHVDHTPAGVAKATNDVRQLIGVVLEHGGRYFLTYHRWAAPRQVLAAYPQFIDFLKLKKKYDPQERLQSTWYRYYKSMFADQLG